MNADRPVPPADEQNIDASLERADQALSEIRAARSTAEIADVFVDTARAWCDPTHIPRRSAVAKLAESNRVEPAMIETAIDTIFGVVTPEQIEALLRREAGEPSTLETSSGNPGARRCGPRLLYVATAGNLPGQAIPVLVCAALARTGAVVRDSAAQPGLTNAFVAGIRAADPVLGDTFVVIEGGRGKENEAATRRAAHIEISGNDRTVAALSSRYRAVSEGEIVEHGARTSAAVVAEKASLPTAAQGITLDAVMYEGRGCLTPHHVFVEGGDARARRFAEELAAALAGFEKRWPRHRQSLEEETARRAFIDESELSALAGNGRSILRADGDSWCIAVGPASRLRPGPGHRCIRVVATDGRRATLKRLTDCETPLAGVSVAGQEPDEAAAAFRAAGATLVCRTGELIRPPLYWEQDGRPRLAGLLAAGGSGKR